MRGYNCCMTSTETLALAARIRNARREYRAAINESDFTRARALKTLHDDLMRQYRASIMRDARPSD